MLKLLALRILVILFAEAGLLALSIAWERS